MYTCDENSPVGDPAWGTAFPLVDMRRIFCGSIENSQAYGLRSFNTETNWQACARADHCLVWPDKNGYGGNVEIFDSQTGTFKEKLGGSTVWPATLTPTQLVYMFQMLYHNCNHGAPNVGTFCFENCYWSGNTNQFDIVLAADDTGIFSAYPTLKGTCDRYSHEWQMCGPVFCQGL